MDMFDEVNHMDHSKATDWWLALTNGATLSFIVAKWIDSLTTFKNPFE